MKRIVALLLSSVLVGCASLHVSWTATASYNMPTVSYSAVQQGAERQKEVQ